MGLLALTGEASAGSARETDALGLTMPRAMWFVKLSQPIYIPPQFVYTHTMLCYNVVIFRYQTVDFHTCYWDGGQITVYWSQVSFRVRVESPVVQPGGALFEGDGAPGEEGPETND